MNTLNEFLDSYKNGIPVTVKIDAMSVVVLSAGVLVTALIIVLINKYLS